MNTVAKQKGTSKTTTLLKTIGGAVLFLTVLLGYTNFFSHPTHSESPTKTVSTVAINQSSQIDSTHSQSVFDATYTFQKTVAFATGGTTGWVQTDPAKKGADVDFVQLLQSLLKTAYIFIWPFLWIAGIAMDNSLVYGEVFWLDKALWQFWQIARNFANFIIWFIFLRQVLKYIFDIKSWKSDTTNVTKIITKLLLSSVGVQTSWFIMWALVDLSIVLTAGLWSLPLNIIDETVASRPILGIKTSVKLNTKVAKNDNLVMLYTWEWANLPKKYILPCLIEEKKIKWGTDFMNAYKLAEEITPESEKAGKDKVLPLTVKKEEINEGYCVYWQDVLTINVAPDGTSMEPASEAMQKMIIDSRKEFVSGKGCEPVEIRPEGYDPNVSHFKTSNCTFLWNLARKGMWKQWSFFSLYASILGLSSIHLDAPQTTATLTIETLLKIAIMIGFLVPLIALVVVLIMRVAYLWVIIAFSPLIALGIAWDILPKDNPLTKKFTLKSILSLILLPVVVTFALSLSIIMLSALSEWFARNWSLETVGVRSKVIDGASCYDVWITNLCISSKSLNFWAGITDYFAWIIMNIFGIGLMWFVVMAALKTNELTAKTVESIEWVAKWFAWWLQFIPLPGGGYWSIWGITWAVKEITSKITNAPGQQVSKTADIIDWIGNNLLGKDRKLEGQISAATNATLKSDANMQTILGELNRIVTDDSLFKDLNENASQIAGLTGYFNALNAKMGSSDKFDLPSEVYDPKSAKWTRFLTNLAAYGDTYLGEGKWSEIVSNMKFFYKTNGDVDKNIQDYLQQIIDNNNKAKKTYKIGTNGVIQKIVKINPNDDKEKRIELEASETEKESLISEYDEYIKKIKLAEGDENKWVAEKELSDWITKTFGDTTRQDVENVLRPTKTNKPNNGAKNTYQTKPASWSWTTTQSWTNNPNTTTNP